MKQLRIAQVANFVAPKSGGIKVVIEALGRGYVEDGHERLLIVPGPKDLIKQTPFGTLAYIGSPKIGSVYRMIFRLGKVKKLLNQFQPTSIECSDKWTLSTLGSWGKKHHIGTIQFSHERLVDMAADFLGTNRVRPLIMRWSRHLAKVFDVVVATSRYSATEWDQLNGDVRLVPLGVDLDLFSPRSASLEPLVDKNKVRRKINIVYAGRLSQEKYPRLAIETAVELARRKVDFELKVYGSGPQKDELVELAADAPVIFEGFVSSREEIAACFGKADLVFSMCPTETFGLAPLEALACGTPVISANVGGASETVDETCGEQGDPNASSLADATQRLIGRLGPQLRLAARARAEQYPWSRTVQLMENIHLELAEKYSR